MATPMYLLFCFLTSFKRFPKAKQREMNRDEKSKSKSSKSNQILNLRIIIEWITLDLYCYLNMFLKLWSINPLVFNLWIALDLILAFKMMGSIVFPSQESRPIKKPRLGPPEVYPQDSRQKEVDRSSSNSILVNSR